MKCGNSSCRYVTCFSMNFPKESQDPLSTLREKFIIGLQYIANNPRQRALMQILYQKCEFSSDMMPEAEIRKELDLVTRLFAGFAALYS